MGFVKAEQPFLYQESELLAVAQADDDGHTLGRLLILEPGGQGVVAAQVGKGLDVGVADDVPAQGKGGGSLPNSGARAAAPLLEHLYRPLAPASILLLAGDVKTQNPLLDQEDELGAVRLADHDHVAGAAFAVLVPFRQGVIALKIGQGFEVGVVDDGA